LSAISGVCAAGQELPTFAAETRLVEVYATVADSKGRFVEGLQRDQFTVRDNGEPQPISVFEAGSRELSCAILMDTTGSMKGELPVVKSAILRFIDNLPDDAKVGVYTFANTLNTVQDFTTDRKAAKQGVLRTYAAGTTALFDGHGTGLETVVEADREEVPDCVHGWRRQREPSHLNLGHCASAPGGDPGIRCRTG